jgi:hypothetical protein
MENGEFALKAYSGVFQKINNQMNQYLHLWVCQREFPKDQKIASNQKIIHECHQIFS